MTPHHLQSPLLGFATGWHGAQWYRGCDRMQNFSYLPTAGRADEVKPGDWISTPHSFPLHPMMGLGPHNGFHMVPCGQGSPWGLSFMRISILLSLLCAHEAAAGGKRIFQIFELCFGGRILGNGDQGQINISQASGVFHCMKWPRKGPAGPGVE